MPLSKKLQKSLKALNYGESFAILGLGLSGLGALRFLREAGYRRFLLSDTQKKLELPVADLRSEELLVDYELGQEPSERCLNYDCLIVSPGIRANHPLLQKAFSQNQKVITEFELASLLTDGFTAITGTNGKSTVTAWLEEVLGFPACGNIGLPFLQALLDFPSQNHFIGECSSYQLAHSQNLKPQIAVITNFTADHVSWHGNLENYWQAKVKITARQTKQDWLITPSNNCFQQIQTLAQRCWINPRNPENLECAVWIDQNQQIFWHQGQQDQFICQTTDLPLPGSHNVQNALVVIAVSALHGLKPLEIQSRIISFQGLAHRLEFIGKKNGKQFFNDSKSTNPESTICALQSFEEPVIWLAGGRDKLSCLNDLCVCAKQKAASIILYGEARERFAEALRQNGYDRQIKQVKTLAEAYQESLLLEAKFVLFSPACSSFDSFKSFTQRGDYFKKLLRQG